MLTAWFYKLSLSEVNAIYVTCYLFCEGKLSFMLALWHISTSIVCTVSSTKYKKILKRQNKPLKWDLTYAI